MGKKKTTEPKEPVAFNIVVCCLCEGNPEIAPGEWLAHYGEKHPEVLNAEGKLPGRKQMACHMDARDWFQSDYRIFSAITDAEIAQQSVRTPRRRNDPMRF